MDARTRKHAHTDQYVILIAFPLQQWFRERASMLRHTYIVCLVECYEQRGPVIAYSEWTTELATQEWWPDYRQERREFSLFQKVQTGSRAHRVL
jgi:hypothetical protein